MRVVTSRPEARQNKVLAASPRPTSGPPGYPYRLFAHPLSKDYEYRVQTSEAMIGIAAIRLMLNRLVPA